MRTLRTTVLLSAFLLAIAACKNATEPLPSGSIDELRSAEVSESNGYVATLLPGGTFTGHNIDAFLVVADNGDVFGSTGTEQAAKWTVDASGDVTGPTLLGTLPAPFDNAVQFVRSTNTNGDVVVGYAGIEPPEPVVPWLWTNGSMMLLPLPENVTRAWPFGVNDAGVVVGQIRLVVDGVSTSYGAVWFPPYESAPTLLPRLESYIIHSAWGITNAGDITGWVRDGDGLDALVQWQIDGQTNVISGPDILESGSNLLLSAANSDLDAVGSYYSPGREGYLFRTDIGQRIDLGVLEGQSSSSARGITRRAPDGTVQIAGSSFTMASGLNGRAVAWSVDGSNTVTGPADIGLPEAYPKNRPSHRFETAGAFSINSQGWIVGWSRRGDGSVFSVIWQPAQPADDDPPPPSGDGPTASFDYNCQNTDTCHFADTSTPGSSGIVAWLWSSTSGDSADTQNSSFTFDHAGSYTVTLEVTDGAELSAEVATTVACKAHRRRGLRCS